MMSRRSAGSIWDDPEPPYRYVKHHGKRKKKRTELHDAFCSLGRDRRVESLSEGEFQKQVFQEAGYCARKAIHHFGNAADAIVRIGRSLFLED